MLSPFNKTCHYGHQPTVFSLEPPIQLTLFPVQADLRYIAGNTVSSPRNKANGFSVSEGMYKLCLHYPAVCEAAFMSKIVCTLIKKYFMVKKCQPPPELSVVVFC